MSTLDLSIIGNGSYSALLDQRGKIVWSCLPRFDSDPRFCALLNDRRDGEKGFYEVELLDLVEAEQQYRHNSAVVETVLKDKHGGVIQINFGSTFLDGALRTRQDSLRGVFMERLAAKDMKYGDEGTALLEAMMTSIKEEQARY